jgi:CelD/BcsL family acetyltransferase involved in cellulose biosynthesis
VESARLLERLHAGSLFPVVTRRTVAPSMRMENAEAAIRKKSLKRNTNKLSRAGDLTIRTTARADEVLPQLPRFFRQHQARWGAAGQPSQFDADVQRELFVALTHAMSRSGALRFTTVALDNQPVAFHFGMVSHGRFTWYKPTYAPELAEYSPGEVLLRALIDHAQTEPVTEFDFTVGSEPFKLRFATVVRDVVDLIVFRSPTRARLLSAKIGARELLKHRAPGLAEKLRSR